MPVCRYLSLLNNQGHIAKVGIVVQLHHAVQHLDFAGGLLLLWRWLPPKDLYCFAHEVTSHGDRFVPRNAQSAPNHYHAVLHRS